MTDSRYAVTDCDTYVVVTVSGESLSSAEIDSMISKTIAQAGESGKNVVIHRLNIVVQQPSIGDFFFFAKQLEEIKFRRKLALVFPEEMHEGNMEFLEIAATNRGINVKLFASMEEAVQWIEGNGQ